ncbi:MAG: T9SS type A sorting domain-containing protein [Bacteroidales bacterium]|nr:T9SS type A sorting domain-containing protein [Bacteroidales bacterium]
MKKSIFTLLIAFTFGFISAQTVPNGDFESWNGNTPDSWTTSLNGNIITELFGMEVPVPVSVSFGSSTTDAHGGTAALQLAPSTFGIPGTEYSYLMPGIAQLGSADQFNIPLSLIMDIAQGNISNLDSMDLSALATLTQLLAKGLPCTSTPYGVKMWVKYQPAEGDTLTVIAFTKSNGVPASYAYYMSSTPYSDYTQIELQFDDPLAACDSIFIGILTSGFNAHEGTILKVDDITLNYDNTAVSDHIDDVIDIYPNPTTDMLNITGMTDQFSYQLYDLTGRLLLSGNGDTRTTVNVSALPTGVYLLHLQSNDQVVTRKVVVR